MGTEVATTKGGIAAQFEQGHNPYLEHSEGVSDFFGQFLKFSGTTGEISFGEDDQEIEAGHEFIVNYPSAQRGWICWVDGEVVDEVNIVIASGEYFPKENELEDHGPYETNEDGSEDGWSEQYILHLYSEELEQAFTFKTSSKSGIRAVRKLLKAYGSKVTTKMGKDGEYQLTSMIFDVYDFKPKNVKRVKKLYAPEMSIADWIDMEEVRALFESQDGDDEDDYEQDDEDDDRAGSAGSDQAGDDEDEKPARTRRSSKKSEDEDEDEKTARTRRTATRHAPPQDDEDEDDKPARRSSARGRRGRSK